jgi:hypothetical protein
LSFSKNREPGHKVLTKQTKIPNLFGSWTSAG